MPSAAATFLKYADLQMAAEGNLPAGFVGAISKPSLTAGNNRSSRFTNVLADRFIDDKWVVVSHQADTSTGFSGTLFKNENTGELVMSLRSTEFADDAARDNQETNKQEIKAYGWAFGQIDDMEAWYADLTSQGLIDRPLVVTGYSLGGHLATAFNLLRQEEGRAAEIESTYTFNGAGVGDVRSGTLSQVMLAFRASRNSGAAGVFQTSMGRALYDELAVTLNGTPTTEELARAFLTVKNAGAGLAATMANQPIRDEIALFQSAIKQAWDLRVEVDRVVTGIPDASAGGPAKSVAANSVAGIKIDYQLAVLGAAQSTASYRTGILDSGIDAYVGRHAKSLLPNFYDIYGETSPSAVSNSQWHYGVPTPVAIEDQPLYRGDVMRGAAAESLAYLDVKLLVDDFSKNDFGDTHSLVLLIDSLSVQDALTTLDGAADRAVLGAVFRGASNARTANGVGDESQGKAEGDVLENILNNLGRVLLGPGSSVLKGNLDGGTWAVPADRNALYDSLGVLQRSDAYKDIIGRVTLASRQDALYISTQARADFASFISLFNLAPFVVKSNSAADARVVEGALSANWGGLHSNWIDDRNALANGESLENFTDAWLTDRTALLLTIGRRNESDIESVIVADNRAPIDRVYDFSFRDPIRGSAQSLTAWNPTGNAAGNALSARPHELITFGDDGNDNIAGANESRVGDHFYGGGGADTLSGSGGNDYLEGNSGTDTLFGGADNDTLLGGAGEDSLDGGTGADMLQGGADSDILDGGTGSDVLYGGAGADVLQGGADNDFEYGGAGNDGYFFSAGWGKDTIEDSDGVGSIQVEGYGTLTGQGATKIAEGRWESADGRVLFTIVPGSGSTGLDIAFLRNSGDAKTLLDTIRVNKWTPGALGITLGGTVTPPVIDRTIVGDFDKQLNGFGNYLVTADHNYVSVGPVASADDVITGSTDAGDQLFGLNGNDALAGLDGDDALYGGEGDDFVIGGPGRDTLDGGTGRDVIFGSGRGALALPTDPAAPPPVADGIELTRGFSWVWWLDRDPDANGFQTHQARGADYSTLYDDANLIDGGAGGDWIYGATGDDTVHGGEGDDEIGGSAGQDILFGDDGDDRIEGDGVDVLGYVESVPAADQGNDLLVGGAGRDTMSGDGGDDELFGGDDDDHLHGDDANPKVTPFAYHGSDYLDGGAGTDELQGGGKNDTLVGGTGNDALYGDASLSQLDGAWHGDDYVDGGEGDDYLEAGGGADTLYGGDGKDMLWGDAASSGLQSAQYGDDLLDGEGGDDTLIGGGKADTLYGGEGDDALGGDGDGDQVGAADQGADYLDGEGGNDSLWGDGKSDTLLGGEGDDFLAGDGDAVAAVDEGEDLLDGGAGKDTLNGNGGGDFLDGGADDDFLDGGAGNDYVAGGTGDDFLLGGAGADTLNGGAGADYLAGGAGDDTYLFAAGDSALNAADFRDTVDDVGGSNDVVIEGAAPLAVVSSADRSDFVIVMADGQGIGIVDGAARANTRYRFGSLDTLSVATDALRVDASESLTAGSSSGDADTDASAAGVWYSVDELIGTFADRGASGTDSDGHRRVLGGRNNDIIVSSSGGATISGGRGDDTLTGSGGANTYLYSQGDGSDLLSDSGAPAIGVDASGMATNGGHTSAWTRTAGYRQSAAKQWFMQSGDEFGDEAGDFPTSARPIADDAPPNRIVFGKGISPSDIRLGGAAGALTLSIGSDPNDRITFGAFDQGAATAVAPIDFFVFADGTMLSYAELVARGFDGAAGDDVLSSTAGNDRLDGREGDDQLFGQAGDDTLTGGAGNDALVGGSGSDRYVFRPGDGQDVIDNADAGSAFDVLSIAESDPADVSFMANGIDLIVRLRGSTDQITVSRYFEGAALRSIAFDNGVIWTETDIASQLTLVSFTDEAEEVTGTNGDDVYFAHGGNDTVWGRGGSDLIDGGDGNDWLHGGAGADTLKGSSGRDVLEGDADDDVLEGGDGGDLLAGGEGADTLDGGPGEDSLYAAEGVDVLKGGSDDDVLEGGGGDDQLDGGDGRDQLKGGDGNDLITGGTGDDSLYGEDGDDRLDGSAGTDVLIGGDGDDTLVDGEWMSGGAGNDTFVLTSWMPYGRTTITDPILGADVLALPERSDPSQVLLERTGGFDDLDLFGPEGSLVVLSGFLSSPDVSGKVQQIRFGDGTVWSVADVFSRLPFTSRTEGDDEIHGFRWSDAIDGLGGNDQIFGWAGNDSLQGNAGADTLSGGDGDDVLDGGAGRDTLDGGSGNDTFLFDAASGRDLIFDYDGEDRVLFASDISPGDVALFRDGLDLVISMSAGAMQARVKRHFADPPPPHDPNAGGFGDFSYSHLERIEFADGTVWNEADIVARVAGSPDAMIGTPGDDQFIVDDARDTIDEGADQGVDTVLSSVSFSLPANVENLTLDGYIDLAGVGNSLDNRIVGNAGNNVLIGGDDRFFRNGTDTFIGGAGDDDYYLDSSEIGPFLLDPALYDLVVENPGEGFDTIWLYGGPYSFTLPDNVEALYVTDAQRVFLSDTHGPYFRSAIGNDLDNTIELRNRDSLDPLTSAYWIIDGGLGADTMRGGDGSDVYVVDNAGDIVDERSASSQPDTVRSSIDYSLGERIENLELVGSKAISGTGNRLSNILDGSTNSAANVLSGGLGNDTYRLGVGDSVIEGAGEGFDTVVFAYRPDDGVFHVDSVAMSSAELFTMDASLGEGFTIVGSAAADSIVYSGFGDLYRFPAPLGGTVEGLDGDDTLVGDRGSDRLDGGAGADRLSGNSGWDTLIGGDGSDWLGGGTGNDILDGGAGDDTLDGGSGDDVYRFGRGAGQDEIGESADASIGKLNVLSFDASVRSSDITLSKSGADLIVELTGGSDRVVVSSFFLGDNPSNPNNPIQRFDFADGSSWGLGAIRAMAVPGIVSVAPVVAAPLPDVVRQDDQRLDFTVPLETFVDPDIGDALTYSATLASGAPLPAWLTFTPETGAFFGNTSAPVGAYAIRVTATDYAGLSASDVLNLTVTTVGRTLMGTSSSDRLVGFAGNDTLLGLEGRDSLYGVDGDDVLYGDADDDVLDGGAGRDLMVGGTGNDQYYVDDLGDTVSESDGEGDLDTVWTSVSYTLPETVEQLYLLGVAPIAVMGSTGSNRIESRNTGSGSRLDGGGGADTLVGGPNDTFVVDDAGDVVVAYAAFDGRGTNTIESSLSWALGANLKDLRLVGSQALDGTGNSLDNHLFGNAGNNRLVGGGGMDTLAGGAGDDTYIGGSVLIEGVDEGVDTVESSGSWTLGANFETLKLTGTPVVIPGFTFFSDFSGTGNELANLIVGSAYRDVIDGKGGADTMNGGAGDDRYVVDDVGDVVGELAGGGTDFIEASVSFALAANVENLTLIGTASINAFGNEGANVLLGNAASNRLDGGAGTDSMSGGAGNDIYVVDQAGDVVTELSGGGDDLVESSISWVLGSEIERLTLTGSAHIDASGNAGANTLTGNAGANRLDGGAGADRMLGGDGDDTYVVDNVGDVVLESVGAGIDSVESSVNTTLASAVEKLVLTGAQAIDGVGNELDNRLTGNTAANRLAGGAGDDTLEGGIGNDTLDGGAGDDTYLFARGYGVDTISAIDITAGKIDTISLAAGIVAADLVVTRETDDLVLTIRGAVDSLRVRNHFASNAASGAQIDRVRFADGTTWTVATIQGLLNTNHTPLLAVPLLDQAVARGSAFTYTVPAAAFADSDNDPLTYSARMVDGNPLPAWLGFNATTRTFSGNSGAAALGATSIRVTASDPSGLSVSDVFDLTVRPPSTGQVIFGTTGDDYLSAGVGDDTIFAGAGNDWLWGGIGDNVLYGEDGNDYLFGGVGKDTGFGGRGDDYYFVDRSDDIVIENFNEGADIVSAQADYILSANVETLYLSGSATSGTGNSLDNYLSADYRSFVGVVLDGGGGADQMSGTFGNDTYLVDNAGDSIYETVQMTVGTTTVINTSVDTVRSSITYTLAGNLEKLVLTGSAAIDGTGNAGANAIVGNAAPNRLTGGAGDDSLDGGNGNDTLDGGAGNDLLSGGLGNDTYLLNRGSGADSIDSLDTGAGKSDVLAFGAGVVATDIVLTREGDDLLASMRGSADSVLVRNHFVGDAAGGSQIDQIRFADGTTWSVAAVQSLLSANHLPKVAVPLPDRTVAVGTSFDFSFAASSFADADGDALAYSVQMPDGSALPSWVAFDPATRTFSGVAPLSATMVSVVVAASDPGGLSGFDTFDLTVGSTGGARTLYGTPGSDSVFTGPSTNDTIYAGAGNDTVYGYAGNNALYGGDGNDYLSGGQGIDSLFGGSGNDSLSGDQGADNLFGGTGNDTFYVDNPADVVVELADEGDDVVTAYVDYTLADNIERLTLVSGATRGTGNASNNFIFASFNTTAALFIDGGVGADTLYGALGNDTYTVDNAGDVVFEFDSFQTGGVTYFNTGIDAVNSWVSYLLPNNVERLSLLGTGNLAGTGNSLANAITGNDGNNALFGAGGNDTLTGGAGDDTLDGGTGSDIYHFGRGDAADLIASLDATAGKTDTLQLGAAIASSDIVVTRQTNDLLVSIRGTEDSVRVRNHFLGNGNQIDQIRFADGSSWNGQAIVGQLSAQSPATAMSASLAARSLDGAYRARGLLFEEVGDEVGGDYAPPVGFDEYSAGPGSLLWAPDGLLAAPSPDPFAAGAQGLVDVMAIFSAGADTPPLGAVHQVTLMPVTLPQHAF